MPRKVSAELAREIIEQTSLSLKSGRAVRRANIRFAGLILVVLLAILWMLGVLDRPYAILLTVAVATLCLIWAVMSASASLNAQFDVLTAVIVHYAENRNTGALSEPSEDGSDFDHPSKIDGEEGKMTSPFSAFRREFIAAFRAEREGGIVAELSRQHEAELKAGLKDEWRAYRIAKRMGKAKTPEAQAAVRDDIIDYVLGGGPTPGKGDPP